MHSLCSISVVKFIYVYNDNDADIEKNYAVFWRNSGSYGIKKMPNYRRNDIQIVSNYFSDGGENYTLDELIHNIERDLWYSQTHAKKLITECKSNGWITEVDTNVYTR